MSLGWFVVRRVAWAVVATYLILTLTFGLLVVTPDVGVAELQFEAAASGGEAGTAADAYATQRGQDRPVLDRYVEYVTSVATLNWGWSESRSQPVVDAIAEAWPYTVMYAAPAILISTVLGVGIGLYSATHRYTTTDYVATFVAFFGLSIPDFWLGIVLLVVLAGQLQLVPLVFDPTLPAFSLANARQLLLPVFVLGTGTIAAEMRYTRAESLEYVRATFVKAARARGASERQVALRHVLRPALVPLSTVLIGDFLGLFIASSYLVEVVFGIPGLGRLSLRAIETQDTALVLGTTLVPVFVVVLGTLLQDLAYTALDPRIDYGDRK